MRHNMRRLRLLHNGRRVAALVWQCESFTERALGWIGQTPMPHQQVLRIPGCRAIHTFGLRHSIDVAFTDRRGRVLRCVRKLPPRRVVAHVAASAVWEMRGGYAEWLGLEVGSELVAAGEP